MTFSKLSKYLQELEKIASRNEITCILSDLFKESESYEIGKICYLLSGKVAPSYEGIEFNFAEKMMVRAIAQAYDAKPDNVLKEYKKTGDLGNVVERLANGKKLIVNRKSVLEVYETLYKVAIEGGAGSQGRRVDLIAGLLSSVDSQSAKYIARIPVGRLRLGFSDITMLDALSVMETGDKRARKQIEAVYSVTADIGRVAERIKKNGLKGTENIEAEAGVPVRSSLAERLPNAEKIVEKLGGKFAVEPKMDGFRVQLHVWRDKGGKGKRVMIFSRNLENVTAMFPDLVEAAKDLPIKSGIFDGEAIGYNPKTNKFIPFQETVQRKRKHGIDEMSKFVPLKVFIFDVLYLNGQTVLEKPFWERRKLLEEALGKHTGDIVLAEHKVVTTAEELREEFKRCISDGLEGIMAKKLDAAYHAGGRGYHWVKFKKTTEGGLTDTIDCVLMGAYRGKGKRTKFGLGAFLLGVFGQDGRYYTISRLGTGLTDEQFREMYKEVQRLEVVNKPENYVADKESEPDVWVRPELVLEILADEISLSPRHTAGRKGKDTDKDKERGYSLRFPRLIRVRGDKNPDQATSVKEIEKLYKMQGF